VIHPTVERNLSHNIHTSIPKLQGDHGYIGFRYLKRVGQPTFFE
jgi:hypothetical protein